MPAEMVEGSFCAATIAPRRFIGLARATARSFLAQHPEIPFFVLVTDGWDGYSDAAQELFQSRHLQELEIPGVERFRFQYDELELAYATTPYWIHFLLRQGFTNVLFLKMETMVVGKLDPLWEAMREHSVVVTPHFLAPPRRADALEWELNVLRAGIFNGGVLGFRGCEEGRGFLRWWERKTWRNCLRAVDEGLHFEQRWLDFVPALTREYRILRDPGVNVGHWNLAERQVEIREGAVWVNGEAGRIFRFSGYEVERPEMVTKYHQSLRVKDTGAAAEVFAQYQKLLEDSGHFQAQAWPYGLGRFDNGVAVSPKARKEYRDLGDAAEKFGDPLLTGHEDNFYAWLRRKGIT